MCYALQSGEIVHERMQHYIYYYYTNMDNKQIYVTVVLEKFTLFVNLTSFLFVFRLRYLFLQVQYIAT